MISLFSGPGKPKDRITLYIIVRLPPFVKENRIFSGFFPILGILPAGEQGAPPAGLLPPLCNRPRTSELRLPLEGKLAQRQLRLMRSKRSIITIGWYDAVTFDLIRSGLSRTTVVEVRLPPAVI